jgi:hypothetical protein
MKKNFIIGLLFMVFLIVFSYGVQARELLCSDGMVALWKFDTDNSTKIVDYCGYQNLTISSANYEFVGGVYGNAYKNSAPTGALSYASSLTNGGVLNITGKHLSVEMWINVTHKPIGLPCIFSKFGGTNGYRSVDYYNSDIITSTFGTGSVANTFAFNSSQWYHFVVTYDGDLGKIKQYINSVKLTTEGSYTGNISSYAGAFLLAYCDGQGINATFDEVAVYDRALNSSEILEHYSPCVENWVAQYSACGNLGCAWNERYKTYLDTHECGTYDDLPVDFGTCEEYVSCVPAGEYSLTDDYAITGYDSTFHISSNGNFNTGLTTALTMSSAVSSGLYFTPQIADLDNDGYKEIVALDRATSQPKFKVFQVDFENEQIDLEATVNLFDTTILNFYTAHSNIVIANTNKNIYPEIAMAYLVSPYNQKITFVEYNGTGYSTYWANLTSVAGQDSTAQNSFLTYQEDYFNTNAPTYTLGCFDDGCFIAGRTPRGTLVFYKANMTQVIEIENQWYDGVAGNLGVYANSMFPQIAFNDIDYDGYTEAVFVMPAWYVGTTSSNGGVLCAFQTANDRLSLNHFNSSCTNLPNRVQSHTLANYVGDTQLSATSPLVAELDENTADGMEIILGYKTGDRGYKMLRYDSNLDYQAEYPLTVEMEGDTISNIFELDYFPDTNGNDIAMVVYDNATSEMYYVVTNVNKLYTKKSFNVAIPTNPSKLSGAVHTFETDSTGAGDEIINSYGIYKLSYSLISQTMTKVYDFTSTLNPAVVIPFEIDYGVAQIIALTTSKLYVISDGSVNKQARVHSTTINPCAIGQPLRINTTMTINATLTDYENDKVRTRAYVYYGDSNQQESDWSELYTPLGTAGVNIPIDAIYEINKTGNNYVIRVEAQDINNGTPSYVNYKFSVDNEGLWYDDSVCVKTGNEEDDYFVNPLDALDTTNATMIDNPVIDSLNTISVYAHTPVLLMWLILMLVICIGLLYYVYQESGNMTIAFTMSYVSLFVMTIIGRLLNIVPMGIVVTMIVILIIPLALWIRGLFFEGR